MENKRLGRKRYTDREKLIKGNILDRHREGKETEERENIEPH